ncbi:Prophage PssSM-03, Orf15 [Pseudomonas syringae pv. atrofaciens]|uniref:Uncharacterized protein n=1 Tax=Pseudomonas syringae pv. atrofaciens TaxID=192087 RepID=A0A0P9IMY4_PSESX|nr:MULTISPECIES: hypothetical protein [Pseudomonas syringae group]AVX22829.1 hypothetical protein DA456_05175 [Pseudomonas syringae pv. atrofaciens]KPW10872.1 Prophage PssSM-03, Orf15 [Pseudomonas syringae pv. atrofaciens]MBI6795336.1 hypothetical protein [Pseudomonas syringae]QVI69634.1 hypothetical protein KHW12_21235 [Pseudomonas syringae]RMM52297.1 hypothetical protein ALQ76_200010 [Pseudomonas syringae pv. atrofaciens]
MPSAFPFSQRVVDIIATGKFMPVYAVQLDFADGMVFAHTGTGDLVVDGITYEGVGNFGQVSQSKESDNSGSPMSVDLTLSGLDSYILSETNLRGCRGRMAKIIFVVFDEAGNYAADILFSGRMDAPKFSFAGNGQDGNTITVPVIDRMAEWSRTGTERWTDENHRARHQGDRFFYAIAQMSEWPIYWGAAKDAPTFTYGN